MSDDVKLPETVEEYQRVRRQDFEDGGQFMYQHAAGFISPADAQHVEAKRRYPIKRKVPRVLTLTDWTVEMRDDGRLHFDNLKPLGRNDVDIDRFYIEAEDIGLLAHLLANPFEEVDE